MRNLAPYAVGEANSRGRRIQESPPSTRGEFARDRDRVIHSTAFRRLEYKTQVFVNHEGDLFRTRLTHSVEVAQIARSIARALNLNDDLAEAIALAHDLGHTPFGHAGQEALNQCMMNHGGFEHNLQSLRIVDVLEERYGAFDGLNLMFETREGILKRCSKSDIASLGDIGFRFREDKRPSLEAQVCDLADEIAYNNHDIDDGLRSGLLDIEDLRSVSLFAQYMDEALGEFPELGERRLVHETVRRMIGAQVVDLVGETAARIERYRPASLEEVRDMQPMAAFSSQMKMENAALKRYLFRNLYRHPRVVAMNEAAADIVRELFDGFMALPETLPAQYRDRASTSKARTVADYIAGMTDRYAIREHRRLYGERPAHSTGLPNCPGYGY